MVHEAARGYETLMAWASGPARGWRLLAEGTATTTTTAPDAGTVPDGPVQQVQDVLAAPSLDAWDIALAGLIAVLGWFVARYVARATLRLLEPVQGLSADFRRVAARVVRVFIVVLGMGIALGVLGAEIRPVLAASLLVGVVAALSLRGVAENFSAGLVLQGQQPVRAGDQADILGHEGVVLDINSRSVVLETFDGREVHLPNRMVLDEPLINESAAGRRRSELQARWDSHEIDAEFEMIRAALLSVDDVLATPPPAVLLVAAEGSRITVLAHFWHLPADTLEARSTAVARVASALSAVDEDRAVITPPPPPPFTPPPVR